MKMYDCPHEGIPKRDRREHERAAYNDKVEHLFNGFDNAIRNIEQADRYWGGYLRAMRLHFAELVRETPSLHIEKPPED